jgi:hypothetical protein
MKITEHSRDGSDWVDDIQSHQHDPFRSDGEIQGHPRGRVGRAWQTRQDVRKYAAEQGIAESQAVESGLKAKAKEFAERGSEVYTKA